jgi:hypothetical protein
MTTTLKLVQGDTLPQIVAYLNDQRVDTFGNITTIPIDLTDTIVAKLKLRVPGTTTLVDTLTGVVVTPQLTAGAVNSNTGIIVFGLTSLSLASSSSLEAELELTQLGGGVFTPYEIIKIKVRSQF